MASHVVVMDSSLRRVTVKTTPATHLSNILDEACSKLGLKPEQYGLKHDNKQVDLSRTIRLSGLSSGAKLNLVQASRSPSVVSVALQLPTDIAPASSPARLTDKFPSNTTIWQILRRFEAGAAGAVGSSKPNYNFTQRAAPLLSDGKNSGSGRLCYEMPVVNVMGRELGSFVDLQKTLQQLGFNSGSCLLRLNYRNTEQPLEEAMAEISRYFQEVEEPTVPAAKKAEEPRIDTMEGLEPTSKMSEGANATQEPQEPPTALETTVATDPAPTSFPTTSTDTNAVASGFAVFAPPSSAIPAAAADANYREEDYIPTIVHAQQHQARLQSESRNKKLLSDAEIEAQQQNRTKALSAVRDVVVRFRFPDQSQAQQSFGRDATSSSLHDFCRELMERPAQEGFSIKTAGVKGATETVPENAKRLIQDLGWQGRVLVTVIWADNVSAQTRSRPTLKEQYRKQAAALKVDLEQASRANEDDPAPKQEPQKKRERTGDKQDKESKLKGLLKGLSKK